MTFTKRERLKALKASGDHPADWFKGYTKFTEAEQDSLLMKCAAAGLPPLEDAKSTPSNPADTDTDAQVDRGVPEGIPVTSDGYPVRVQVVATRVVTFRGATNRTLRRGTIFAGETAWALWDEHRVLVAPVV